jgi:hypothetical protein
MKRSGCLNLFLAFFCGPACAIDLTCNIMKDKSAPTLELSPTAADNIVFRDDDDGMRQFKLECVSNNRVRGLSLPANDLHTNSNVVQFSVQN